MPSGSSGASPPDMRRGDDDAAAADVAEVRRSAGASIVLSRLDDLPPDVAIDRSVIQQFGPKSNVTMPLMASGQIIGALAFGATSEPTSDPRVPRADRDHGNRGRAPGAPLQLRRRNARPRVGGAAATRLQQRHRRRRAR